MFNKSNKRKTIKKKVVKATSNSNDEEFSINDVENQIRIVGFYAEQCTVYTPYKVHKGY